MNKDVYQTATEAADAIGTTAKTVTGWYQSGRLNAERVPRSGKDALRIRHDDLIEASRGTVFEQPLVEAPQMRLGIAVTS